MRIIGLLFLITFQSLKKTKSHKPICSSSKILIVQKAGLGDFLMLLPTLLAISNSDKQIKMNILVSNEVYPLAKRYNIFHSIRILNNDKCNIFIRIKSLLREIIIGIMTPYDVIFQPCSGVNVVTYLLLVFTKAKLKIGFKYPESYNYFDICIDYNQEEKDIIQNSKILKFLGIENTIPTPEIQLNTEEIQFADRLIEKLKKSSFGSITGREKIIGIYPTTMEVYGENSRDWGANKFASFIDCLNNICKDILFIFFGSRYDKKYCEEIISRSLTSPKYFVSAGEVNIFNNCALAKHCNIIVGIDGGFMHFLNIIRIPSIVLWGPTTHKNHGYENTYTTNLSLNVECSPCYGNKILRSCNHRKCLNNIEAGYLCEIVKEKLLTK